MHFHKYSCEADVQKISSFFKTKQQFSCQKVCFKINVIQPKGFKKYVVHIVLAGNQTKDRCRTRAKNIPISIFAYCKNKPLCAILVSCRNPQVLFFALLQMVVRSFSPSIPRKKSATNGISSPQLSGPNQTLIQILELLSQSIAFETEEVLLLLLF